MSAYLIETDGRTLAAVESQLRKYLPGLDVRLFPLSSTRAVLRGHLLWALSMRYTAPRDVWLAALGIGMLQALTDEQTLGILQGRDPSDLPRLRPANVIQRKGLDWHLDAVNVQPAWDLLGGPDAIGWGTTKVAHIDTGYTLHPAFGFPAATWVDVAGGRTDMPPVGGEDIQLNAEEIGGGRDGVREGFNGGHGTRIGATICGWDPQAAGGAYYGLAPKVPYLPVRITDAVLINHAQGQLADALDYAVQSGADVVNVSMGIFAAGVRDKLKDALDRAYEAGVIVVCAAGNFVDPVVAPARLPRTVAVAGVTREDRPWSGSSFGPEVDFSAPAADLRRADVSRSMRFGYSAGGDGTSYATAITSAAAALWLTHRRGALAGAYSQRWCVVEAFTELAKSTVRLPANAPWEVDRGFGKGVLDIGELLAAALPPESSLRKAPAA